MDATPSTGRPLKVGVTLHPYYSWTANVVKNTDVEVRPILPGEVDAGEAEGGLEVARRLGNRHLERVAAQEPRKTHARLVPEIAFKHRAIDFSARGSSMVSGACRLQSMKRAHAAAGAAPE